MIYVRNDGNITQVGSFNEHAYCNPLWVRKMCSSKKEAETVSRKIHVTRD
jgi:hypothetical protein